MHSGKDKINEELSEKKESILIMEKSNTQIEILEKKVKPNKSFDLEVSETHSESSKSESESLVELSESQESMELVIQNEKLSQMPSINPKYESIEEKKEQTPEKIKLTMQPELCNSIFIFHLDSMSTKISTEVYLKTCKVLSHIINYLMIKEINTHLNNVEIIFENEICKVFPPKDINMNQDSQNENKIEEEKQENDQIENLPQNKTIYFKKRMKVFTKKNCFIKSIKVPQQTNFSDCGICVLENIETIIMKPFLMETIHQNAQIVIPESNNVKEEDACNKLELEYPSDIFLWKRMEIIKLLIELEKRDKTLEELLEQYLQNKIEFHKNSS